MKKVVMSPCVVELGFLRRGVLSSALRGSIVPKSKPDSVKTAFAVLLRSVASLSSHELDRGSIDEPTSHSVLRSMHEEQRMASHFLKAK